jgi:IS30 family transposase
LGRKFETQTRFFSDFFAELHVWLANCYFAYQKKRAAHIFKDSRGQIAEAIPIRERPAEIEDRAIPGHWEGDLLSGSKNSHIVTLVERHSRFTTLLKVPSKDTAVVVAALTRHARILPATLRRSLTWDRGLEMQRVIERLINCRPVCDEGERAV